VARLKMMDWTRLLTDARDNHAAEPRRVSFNFIEIA
jgi:hypothetical protein